MPSVKSRTSNFGRGRPRGRSKGHSLHRSDFSLTTDDGKFGPMELELGASTEDLNSLAYSVYSDSRTKLSQKNMPIAGGQINLPKIQNAERYNRPMLNRQISVKPGAKNLAKKQFSSNDCSRNDSY